MAGTLQAQFGSEHEIPIEGPVSVRAADLDADGDADLVVGSRAVLGWFENTDGAGTMGSLVTIGSTEIFVHVADLNADGEQDIVCSLDASGGIRWRAGLGAGSFAAAVTISPTDAAVAIASTDLDQDGDPDLVFAMENGNIEWAENTDGLGTFSAPGSIAAGQSADHVQAVDLDGNGSPDLLWSNSIAGPTSYALNQGGGVMGPVQTHGTGQLGRAVDVDGDGLADLVSYLSASSTISWQRNLGGSFDPSLVSVGTGVMSPSDMIGADLNGDGSLDLAVTEQYPDRLVWYANDDGNGSFGEEQEVGGGLMAPRSPIVADLDGDGDGELMSASVGQQRYVWYDNLSQASYIIAGRVYNDLDHDGSFGGVDHGLAGIQVRIAGGATTYTNASGVYSFEVIPGNYTVEMSSMDGWDFTADSSLTVNVPFTGEAALGNDLGLFADSDQPELTPVLTTAPRKCGYVINYWLNVTNSGNQVGDASLSLTLDPLNTFVSSEPAFSTHSGQNYGWDLHDLAPTHARQVWVTVLVPSAESIGATIVDTLRSELRQGGTLVHSGVWIEEHLLTCSFDPNDKEVVPIGQTPQHLVATGQRLNYTIRFQNTGTAPADNVLVIDTLDADLDLSTLELTGASHAMHLSITQDNVMQFFFPDIQLPDSGSNEVASHGFVGFSIEPRPALPDMTVAENAADIVFDLNAPVRTNTVFNTFSEAYVGIQDESMAAAGPDLVIWPNPLTSTSLVHLPGNQGPLQLIMIDVRGQVVRTWNVQNSATVVIDRAGLRAGLYQLSYIPADRSTPPSLARLVVE